MRDIFSEYFLKISKSSCFTGEILIKCREYIINHLVGKNGIIFCLRCIFYPISFLLFYNFLKKDTVVLSRGYGGS